MATAFELAENTQKKTSQNISQNYIIGYYNTLIKS